MVVICVNYKAWRELEQLEQLNKAQISVAKQGPEYVLQNYAPFLFMRE